MSMKLRKNLGRIATAFVATAMLASLSAVPASAAEESSSIPSTPVSQDDSTPVEEGESFYITKYLTKEEKTMTPNAEFTFTYGPAQPGKGEVRNGLPVNTGIIYGVAPDKEEGTAKFTPGDELDRSTKLSTPVKFNVDLKVFEEPGVYKYYIRENDHGYDGISKDYSTLYLYVYIANDEKTGELKVAYTELVSEDGTTKTDSFTNDYDSAGNKLHDLTVYKVLTGNAATMTDEAKFKVKVEGESGEKYYVEFGTWGVPAGAEEGTPAQFIRDEAKDPIVITSGSESAVITLGHNEAFKVYGLDSDDTYTVTETTANQDNYSLKINEVADEDGVTSAVIDEDTVVEFDNHKEFSTPTGIVMNVAPYALLVVVAAGACFVFLRKRRED